MRLISLFFLLLNTALSAFQGELAQGVFKEHSPYDSQSHFVEVVAEKTLFCDSIYFSGGWGHAVQDTVIPIYKHIKDHDLLMTPVCLCILTDNEQGPIIRPGTELLNTLFPLAKLKIVSKKTPPTLFLDVEVIRSGIPGHGSDGVLIGKYMEYMRSFGFATNVVTQLPALEWNIAHDFVDYVLERYQIGHIEMVPNQVCIINKKAPCARRIINAYHLYRALTKCGFSVKIIDFGGMSVRDQIIAIRSSEFIIGTHGAALTNTMFLQKNASVAILWPEDAKYFHNRFYCPFTSILLSRGIQLIEYDKPRSRRDIYTMFNDIQVPEYFYRDGKDVRLKPEKKNWKDILAFPRPCMYDIYNVDIYVDRPMELANLILESSKRKIRHE